VEQDVDGDVGGVGGIVVGELPCEHADDLFEQGFGHPVGQISPDESLVHGPPRQSDNPFALVEHSGVGLGVVAHLVLVDRVAANHLNYAALLAVLVTSRDLRFV